MSTLSGWAKRLAEDARLLAEAAERADSAPEQVIPPLDGKPSLRPHGIKGWWQVWSGGMCIALLTPEDVKPLTGSREGKCASCGAPSTHEMVIHPSPDHEWCDRHAAGIRTPTRRKAGI